ncbi:MAG: hypothetical protein D0433_09370 [Candidatus Thermochlorobacter aerophilum]|uniref:Uncharacterized protein n=1 Tax=Candidatus Thermochlorobacter aerophilus TaxID=1868324 RepID=A0A395LYZ9_9BACT|nr:MAG: hypothetical protein D0433_09370 [Candidatus Thermochlorobacter aerophilum]
MIDEKAASMTQAKQRDNAWVFRKFWQVALMLGCVAAVLWGCTINPFAPRLELSERSGIGLGDQRTIDGFFRNFEFAYLTRDTALYGQLLSERFTFVYRDFDNGVDVIWPRDVELVTTSGLFRSAEILDLRWNTVVFQDGDARQVQVVRSFRLRVGFRINEVFEITGNANFTLVRDDTGSVWRLSRWRDESNF